jgi:predicted RNase H-like HicB family nuclease
MNYSIDTEQEDDGRWLAEVPDLPGVLAYGATKEEAQARAQVLALRVIAEQLEHGEARPIDIHISVPSKYVGAVRSEGAPITATMNPCLRNSALDRSKKLAR